MAKMERNQTDGRKRLTPCFVTSQLDVVGREEMGSDMCKGLVASLSRITPWTALLMCSLGCISKII